MIKKINSHFSFIYTFEKGLIESFPWDPEEWKWDEFSYVGLATLLAHMDKRNYNIRSVEGGSYHPLGWQK